MPGDARPRVAIVLFNLGGPDRPEAIRPFLLNLFRDPAILRAPFFVRSWLARRIAAARLAPATANYALLGGRSPLLELTQAQAAALETALPELEAKCFIAMRYWHPLSGETARQVKRWDPDDVVLLPLYPQFSTTTTGSSLAAWREASARVGLIASVTTLCCYPDLPGFTKAVLSPLQTTYVHAERQHPGRVRLLFSAHGLPEVIVRSGDPYQWQIGRTVQAVLDVWTDHPADWAICFQSRATPQRWLEPSTEQELERAARDNVAVVIVPIAFVSDHSETLVELDIEYREYAERIGIRGYFRVPALNDDARFIAALAELVRRARALGPGMCSHTGSRICPAAFTGCPLSVVANA